MELTVGLLRAIAEDILEQLEPYEGDEVVITSSNTYRMGNNILGTRYGFLNWGEIQIEGHEDEYGA